MTSRTDLKFMQNGRKLSFEKRRSGKKIETSKENEVEFSVSAPQEDNFEIQIQHPTFVRKEKVTQTADTEVSTKTLNSNIISTLCVIFYRLSLLACLIIIIFLLV